jgi:hypothetical protein
MKLLLLLLATAGPLVMGGLAEWLGGVLAHRSRKK